MLGRTQARPGGDDVTTEIEVAAERPGLGQLRGPVDPPDRRHVVLPFDAIEALPEQRVELMPAIGRLERFAIEAAAVHRRADQHSIEPSVARRQVRTERIVAVPEAELARIAQRFLPLAAPGDDRLDLPAQPHGARDLDAPPPIVVADVPARTDGGQARLGRGQLPLIVARGEVVQLTADVDLRPAEQRPLEPERVADPFRREFVGEMTGDEGVIEAVVIEDRDPHPERRHEAVDRGEPVFALAGIRDDLEAPRRLAQPDQKDPLAVAVDQVERAASLRAVGAVDERLRIHTAGADRAARRPEENVERLPGAAAVEDVARAQRELVGEHARQLLVHPLKHDTIDRALVDVECQSA